MRLVSWVLTWCNAKNEEESAGRLSLTVVWAAEPDVAQPEPGVLSVPGEYIRVRNCDWTDQCCKCT